MHNVQIADDGKMATLHVPDDLRLADVIAQLEGRRIRLRAGVLRFVWSGHNRSVVVGEWPGIEVAEPIPITIPKRSNTSAYRPRTPCLDHQLEALSRIRAVNRPVFGLFMEPGTGKSKVAIDYAGELFTEKIIKRLLIVAPKGVHRQWVQQQVPEHLGIPRDSTSWPAGPAEAVKGRLLIYATTWDAIKTKKGSEAVRQFLLCREPFMLAIDESHYAKNSRSARWKAIAKIGDSTQCVFKMLLTGTPIAKNLVDEWSQFYLLDPDIIGPRYITTFRREYCIMGGWEGREVVGHRQLDKFKRLTSPYTYRVQRTELGMVPDEHRMWYIKLTDRQRAYIRELKNDIVLRIDSGEIIKTEQITSSLAKIQQISNGWIIDNEKKTIILMPPKDNPRLTALCDWIGINDLAEYPIAIWCRFQNDVKLIMELYPDALPYYGPISDKARETNKNNWLKNGGIFVGTPGSGGVGLNLQGRCARVAYYSLSENYVDRVQSEARFSRIGKLGPIEYTDFIARGSRDMAIQHNLRNKKSLADLTLGDVRDELIEIEME